MSAASGTAGRHGGKEYQLPRNNLPIGKEYENRKTSVNERLTVVKEEKESNCDVIFRFVEAS